MSIRSLCLVVLCTAFNMMICASAVVQPNAVQAGVVSLLDQGHMGAGRGALFAVPKEGGQVRTASLFNGKAKGSMFDSRPVPVPAFPSATGRGFGGSDVEVIRALIQEAESRRHGYDAVQHGARIKTPKRPTEMTLGEVFKWIKDTPGQPHAIGRYQFIPKTLARVVRKTGLGPEARFSPAVQDRLADVLLAEAGLHKFRKGELSRTGFMNNLAKIWAGFPNSTGKSHYHGYAGNKASISWARFDAVMAQIAPE